MVELRSDHGRPKHRHPTDRCHTDTPNGGVLLCSHRTMLWHTGVQQTPKLRFVMFLTQSASPTLCDVAVSSASIRVHHGSPFGSQRAPPRAADHLHCGFAPSDHRMLIFPFFHGNAEVALHSVVEASPLGVRSCRFQSHHTSCGIQPPEFPSPAAQRIARHSQISSDRGSPFPSRIKI